MGEPYASDTAAQSVLQKPLRFPRALCGEELVA